MLEIATEYFFITVSCSEVHVSSEGVLYMGQASLSVDGSHTHTHTSHHLESDARRPDSRRPDGADDDVDDDT